MKDTLLALLGLVGVIASVIVVTRGADGAFLGVISCGFLTGYHLPGARHYWKRMASRSRPFG